MARKGLSPTQRTLRALRDRGMICAITERWNQYAGPYGRREDLFGFVDVLALDPQRGFVGVQACAGSGFASHYRKITEACVEEALSWLSVGGRIELWAWRKVKLQRGGKAMRWEPRVREITLADFPFRGALEEEAVA